jgi:hypothetical protein
MKAQHRRFEDCLNFQKRWSAPFQRQRPTTPPFENVEPAEGWITPRMEQQWIDPLGLERQRHDIAVLDDGITTTLDLLIRQQAKLLRPHMADSEDILNQGEKIVTDEGVIHIVNKVCTIYAKPLQEDEHSLDIDEESEYGSSNNDRVAQNPLFNLQLDMEWDDNTLMPDVEEEEEAIVGEEVKPTGKHQQPPSIFSLRYLQRRCVPLGYNKNSVGTSISIPYTQPWTSSHEVFSTDRIVSMGGNNRQNDRAVLKYCTVPYVHYPLSSLIAKPRRFGAVRRISQNIVASRRLPPGQFLCLGLLHKQFEGGDEKARVPREFNNIVLNVPAFRATLLVYKGNVNCVGASSIASLQGAYAQFDPMFINCLNTPENLAAELEQVKRGSISAELAEKILNYTVLPDGSVISTRKLKELQQEEQEQEAKSKGEAPRRKRQTRVLGAVLQ